MRGGESDGDDEDHAPAEPDPAIYPRCAAATDEGERCPFVGFHLVPVGGRYAYLCGPHREQAKHGEVGLLDLDAGGGVA